MRKFKSGATRSSNENKNEYFGFRHPLVEKSFADYMRKHQVQEDGNKRTADNWWKGWDTNVSLQSLIRHTEDLQALDAGLVVVEITKKDNTTEKIYGLQPITLPKDVKSYKAINREETLNAIKFNVNAYLLELLKNYEE